MNGERLGRKMHGGLAGKLRVTSARTRVGTFIVLIGLVLMVIGYETSPAARADAAITSSGPLTTIGISSTLNCSVNHTGDDHGEWYGDTACGTFLVAGTSIFGPSAVPAGSNVTGASGYQAFTPVSQTGPTGSGTSADPYRIITVVDAGTTGLRVTETDSYVVGQETYRTDVVIANSGGAQNVIAYRAGDCYLQNSDAGFGRFDTNGAVTCVAAADPTADTPTPGTRIEQLLPLTAGSHRQHDEYSAIWAVIGQRQQMNDTCNLCNTYQDNGEGLSWALTVPAGGSSSISNLMSFSPNGTQPMTTSKTADAGTAAPGATDGYTITISNPNATAQTLNSITDTLPAGFSYVPGSTTGATTSNPTISGQTLTWTGSFAVPANGNTTLHFNATTSCTPGTYTNSAGADGGATAVAPVSNTAPVNVTGTPTGACASSTTTSSTTTSTTTPGGGTTSSTTSTTIPGGGTTSSTTSTTIPAGGTTSSTTSTTTPGGSTTSSTTSTTTPSTSTSTSTSSTSTTRPPTTSTSTSTSTSSTTSSTSTSTTTTRPSTAPVTCTVPTLTASPSTLRPGDATTLTATCLLPNSDATLTLASDPVVIGVVHTDAAGGFVTTVKIPGNTPAGNHTITAATGSVSVSTRSASAAIVVIRTLSFTGRGTSHLVFLGLALVFAGIVLMAGHRIAAIPLDF